MAPSAIRTTGNYTSYDLKGTKQSIRTYGVDCAGRNGSAISKQMVGEALRKRIEEIDDDTCEAGEEDTFFVADMGEVYRQHLRWKRHLKRVKPHYGTFKSIPIADCLLTQSSGQMQP